jgi:polysaccharide export outer membrane protein
MSICTLKRYIGGCAGVLLVVLGIALVSTYASAQAGLQVPATPPAAPSDYMLGPGDVVNITFTNSPELNGKARITDSGEVAVPLLSTPIKAEGLTAMQLAANIAEAMKNARQLRDPIVNVFVEERYGRSVTVLGAVAKPSVYPLQRPASLLEVLSMAGGVAPNAGATLTLVHKSSAEKSAQQIAVGKLLKGEDPSLNLEVQAGDVISVSTAPVVYVVGAVIKPGAYVVPDATNGITFLQALASAEGLQPTAVHDRCLILRRKNGGAEGQQQNVEVAMGKLLAGKSPDFPLQPNDIVFIPDSASRRTLTAMARAAQQAVVGIATYGAGLRIGR